MTTAGTGVNLAPLMDAFVALAGAIISTAIPILLLWANKAFGLNIDAQNRSALTIALDNAVGVVLAAGQQAADPKLENVTIKNAAVQAGVQYMLGAVPGAVAHFGLSDNDIAAKIAAKLALMLHVTNSVGPGAAAAAIDTAAKLDRLVEAQDAPLTLPVQ